MSIGLTGAQRTGKSTLARAFSVAENVPFLETGASQVFLDMGLDPKVDYPLDTRIEIQKRILDSFDRQYTAAGRDFITDRTPLCMMAYMLADVQRQNVTPEQARMIAKYVEDCSSVTNSHFTTLVVVQPGIPVIEAEGKAPANFAYMEHISMLVMGLAVSELILPAHYYIPRGMLNLADRVRCLRKVTGRTLEKHQAFLQQRLEQGSPVLFH
jgi:predicted ATPase